MSEHESTSWQARLVRLLALRDRVDLDVLNDELPATASIADMEFVLDGLEGEGIDPFLREGGFPGRAGRWHDPEDRPAGAVLEGGDDVPRTTAREGGGAPLATKAPVASALHPSLHGRDVEGNAAREEALEPRDRVGRLAAEYLPLVHHQARSFRRCGLPYQDLVQGGCEGLVQAAQRWDSSRGKSFRSVATWWIRQGFLKVISESRSFARIPKALQRQIGQMTRTVESLRQELRRLPSSAEIARRLNMPIDWVDAVRHLLASPMSLEAPVPGMDATTLGDLIEDVKAEGGQGQQEARWRAQEVTQRLAELPLTERRILMLRFGMSDGLSRSVEEVSQLTGLSRREVIAIQKRALERLRAEAEEGFGA